MHVEELGLDKELMRLWSQMEKLHSTLREHTKAKYRRINPFIEDLFDWKDKGQFVGATDVTIYDSTTIIGNVSIGDHTWIGPFCLLDGTGNLSIGTYCSISTGTQILTHDTIKWALSGGKAEYEYSPVSIGDYCFIGTNAVVTRGIAIGKHCLIGAGTIVTTNVPDNSIFAGIPGRRIGEVKVYDNGQVELKYSHS